MEEASQNTETVKKVFIQTYGCQMNEYDTEKMFEVLKHQNYFQTDSREDADLIILNTCSIREKAENKVYSELGRLRKLKSVKPELKIGVGGCVAQQEGKEILRREASVDFVFGTDNLFELPEMLKESQPRSRNNSNKTTCSAESAQFHSGLCISTNSTSRNQSTFGYHKGLQ